MLKPIVIEFSAFDFTSMTFAGPQVRVQGFFMGARPIPPASCKRFLAAPKAPPWLLFDTFAALGLFLRSVVKNVCKICIGWQTTQGLGA